MNLHAMLLDREAAGRPVTVGLIGAGKFGTMFLAQVAHTRGMHVAGLADLNLERARAQKPDVPPKDARVADDAFGLEQLADAHRRRARRDGHHHLPTHRAGRMDLPLHPSHSQPDRNQQPDQQDEEHDEGPVPAAGLGKLLVVVVLVRRVAPVARVSHGSRRARTGG